MKYILVLSLILCGFVSNGQTNSITVKGSCDMCAERIVATALNTIGVNTATFDLENQKLEYTFVNGLFDEKELHKNLSNAGHSTNLLLANQDAYNALPGCCQYNYSEDGTITGMILEKVEDKLVPLIGANVIWLGTSIGTITEREGGFSLPMTDHTDQLVVSYIGYNSDTLTINQSGSLNIILDNSITLNTVEVVYKKPATSFSFIDPIKVKQISKKELTKAACCNLSESFETNPSVDVSFTDAVTGTRQIEMLGLAGPYVQITKEGLPSIRGLSALDGFTFIPGSWIQGIQMNFGTGSVINGFESVAGQINVEIKKPTDEERLHINGYGNINGRYEASLFSSFEVSDKISSAVMFHGSARTLERDRNGDNFLDNPKTQTFLIGNRWRYDNRNGQEGQFGFQSTFNSVNAGTIDDDTVVNPWKSNNKVNRHEVWLKRGVIFKDNPGSSIGFMVSGTYHDLRSNYGTRQYNGNQKMLYANLLYSTDLNSENHKITTGTSLQGEQYEETFGEYQFDRNEWVPGVFLEYAYSIYEKFDVVLGLRGDYNNYYGFFATPRMHMRYAPNENHVFRLIAGRGQRTANIFAENIKGMASNRTWVINEDSENSPYGLGPEVAWNYGVNYTYLLDINQRINSLSVDYYFTDFSKQVVTDYDISPTEFHIYNLEGESYSHSVQSQLDLEPLEGLSIRLAYRYNLVNSTLDNELRWKPLTSKHRAFANVGYEMKNGWKFDYTINRIGAKRLPISSSSPEAFRQIEESPSFFIHNAQISKSWSDRFEVYIGGENLLDFRQENPIVSSDNPNNAFFDASYVWGPIFGRNIYAGFRYNIFKDE